jgi:hypothetical protein
MSRTRKSFPGCYGKNAGRKWISSPMSEKYFSFNAVLKFHEKRTTHSRRKTEITEPLKKSACSMLPQALAGTNGSSGCTAEQKPAKQPREKPGAGDLPEGNVSGRPELPTLGLKCVFKVRKCCIAFRYLTLSHPLLTEFIPPGATMMIHGKSIHLMLCYLSQMQAPVDIHGVTAGRAGTGTETGSRAMFTMP